MNTIKKSRSVHESPFVLITGASAGLGKCLALESVRNGYPVLLIALPDTGLPGVAAWLQTITKAEVHYLEIDLTLESGPSSVFNYCSEHKLQIGILINNAGIGIESSFSSLSIESCVSLMQLNTQVVVTMTRLFLPHLKLIKRGAILNVSSLASYTPMPFKGIYSASKAFINSFSCSLRTELKGTGITISVLCPGAIPTSIQVRQRIASHGWFARASMIEPEQLAKIAFRETMRGKQVIIPGKLNRFYKFLMEIIPGELQQKILYRRYVRRTAVEICQTNPLVVFAK